MGILMATVGYIAAIAIGLIVAGLWLIGAQSRRHPRRSFTGKNEAIGIHADKIKRANSASLVQ